MKINRPTFGLAALFALTLLLTACGDDGDATVTDDTTPVTEQPSVTTAVVPELTEPEVEPAPDPPVGPDVAEPVASPGGDLSFFGGFEAYDDDCRVAGESAATIDFLDHTSILVACPIGSARIAEIEGSYDVSIVADDIDGFVLLTVPDPVQGADAPA